MRLVLPDQLARLEQTRLFLARWVLPVHKVLKASPAPRVLLVFRVMSALPALKALRGPLALQARLEPTRPCRGPLAHKASKVRRVNKVSKAFKVLSAQLAPQERKASKG